MFIMLLMLFIMSHKCDMEMQQKCQIGQNGTKCPGFDGNRSEATPVACLANIGSLGPRQVPFPGNFIFWNGHETKMPQSGTVHVFCSKLVPNRFWAIGMVIGGVCGHFGTCVTNVTLVTWKCHKNVKSAKMAGIRWESVRSHSSSIPSKYWEPRATASAISWEIYILERA